MCHIRILEITMFLFTKSLSDFIVVSVTDFFHHCLLTVTSLSLEDRLLLPPLFLFIESQSCLVCIARRLPLAEKTNTMLGVEQFTTRQDLNGKIIECDDRYV